MKVSKTFSHRNLDDVFKLIQSASLGTDPASKPQPSLFSVFLGTKIRNKSSRLTKNLDNSNVFHMFNSNVYTDFRTAHKHVFITSYIIQMILHNTIVTKLNINWLFS